MFTLSEEHDYINTSQHTDFLTRYTYDLMGVAFFILVVREYEINRYKLSYRYSLKEGIKTGIIAK